MQDELDNEKFMQIFPTWSDAEIRDNVTEVFSFVYEANYASPDCMRCCINFQNLLGMAHEKLSPYVYDSENLPLDLCILLINKVPQIFQSDWYYGLKKQKMH